VSGPGPTGLGWTPPTPAATRAGEPRRINHGPSPRGPRRKSAAGAGFRGRYASPRANRKVSQQPRPNPPASYGRCIAETRWRYASGDVFGASEIGHRARQRVRCRSWRDAQQTAIRRTAGGDVCGATHSRPLCVASPVVTFLVRFHESGNTPWNDRYPSNSERRSNNLIRRYMTTRHATIDG
jgi:hypothetical protein